MRHRKFVQYLADHTEMIKKVWGQIKPHIIEYYNTRGETLGAVLDISSNIENHDNSKFSAEEFGGYLNYIFPEMGVATDEEVSNFLHSWNMHQKRNPHHWEYWVLINNSGGLTPLKMNFVYLVEMLCDWTATSVGNGKLPSEHYKGKFDKILLHSDTRKLVESFLFLFDDVAKKIKEGTL